MFSGLSHLSVRPSAIQTIQKSPRQNCLACFIMPFGLFFFSIGLFVFLFLSPGAACLPKSV